MCVSHPYMYSADNAQVKFRICRAMIGDVIDLFGSDVRFSDEDDAGVTVSVFTNEPSAEHFTKSYGPDVVILEPQGLRNRVKEGPCTAFGTSRLW